jgi:hypothetical protein
MLGILSVSVLLFSSGITGRFHTKTASVLYFGIGIVFYDERQ